MLWNSEFKVFDEQCTELPSRSPCVPGCLVCSGSDQLKQQVCFKQMFQMFNFLIRQVCLRPSPSLPVHHAAPGPAAPLRHLPHRLLHQAPRHHCHGQVRERVSSHQVREGSDKEASNCKGHRQYADEAPLPKESVPLLEQFQFIFHLIARKEC